MMNTPARISLCMIMKNEEKFLAECLKSVSGAVDEIVIADTGSTDNSVAIAREFNAHIVSFPWQDDFSAARNFSLAHCTGDWILYLDADEILAPETVSALRETVNTATADAYFCSLYSVDDIGGRPNTMHYLRLFRNKPDIRFNGRVHEQIDTSLAKGKYTTAKSSIRIIHYGYNLTKTELKKKAERNLLLLQKQYAETPDAYTAFQIAQSYGILEQTETALPWFRQASEAKELPPAYRAHSFRFLAAAELEKGNKSPAAELIQNGLALGEKQPLLFIIAGKISYASGSAAQGRAFFAEALEINNKIISGEVLPFFDIMIDPTELSLYIMEFAVNAGDKDLFQLGYDALMQSGNVTAEVKLLNSVFNGVLPGEHELNEWIPELKDNHIGAILNLITRFMEARTASALLGVLYKRFNDGRLALALAEITAKTGDLEKAEDYFTTALAKEPGNPVILFSFISFLASRNKLEQAYKQLCNFGEFQILPLHTKEKIVALKIKLAALLTAH